MTREKDSDITIVMIRLVLLATRASRIYNTCNSITIHNQSIDWEIPKRVAIYAGNHLLLLCT